MLNSTAIMAAAESLSGFKPVHKWGYVTLDWQVGMLNWLQRPPQSTAPTDPAKTTCEATSAANCAALKAAGAVKRCGIYHNMSAPRSDSQAAASLKTPWAIKCLVTLTIAANF